MLRKNLGDDWKNRFENFELTPFASASIGQVHRATLKNG
jgi:predicted unusual protein kinase regulating ubiquinone biosynthesis (AarF/ABC1/UbiB family)